LSPGEEGRDDINHGGEKMGAKSNFSEQEWESLRKGVTGAGLLMSVSDRSFFDSFKEAGALARHVGEARQNESELVRELASERGTGFGLTSSPQEVEEETLQALRESMATLKQKAPEEEDAYRGFVLEVAESVGAAAGGGDTAEGETLERIRSAVAGESTA
jgi:hypothetical protein